MQAREIGKLCTQFVLVVLFFVCVCGSWLPLGGPGSINHAIAFSIFVAFLIAGIWHGAGWNFAIFGLSQGIGLASCHYYTVFLKRRLGKRGYGAYLEGSGIRIAAVGLNYCYFAVASFFFANSMAEIVKIVRACV